MQKREYLPAQQENKEPRQRNHPKINAIKQQKKKSQPQNLRPTLPHPRIPDFPPLNNTKPGRPRLSPTLNTSPLPQKLAITHPPLLPQSRTLLFLNKAIELALDTLEATSLAFW